MAAVAPRWWDLGHPPGGFLLETARKVELVKRMVRAGSRRIEVASYIGLVLNRRGLDRAVLTTVDEVNFAVAG